MAYTVPLGVALLSLTSVPVSFALSKWNLMADQRSILLAGVICLSLATIGPHLIFKRHFQKVDALMYAFSVFCWTCVIDFGIGLELDGYISNFIGYYFVEGEPYLKTAHGTIINYWDGIVHFGLYLTIFALYSSRKSHREVGLFWAGSILNSMVVLLEGGVAGEHPFKLSILLNIPYVFVPLYALFKFIHERPPQSRTFFKFPSLWRRPVDFLFLVYFMFAAVVAVYRGVAISGGNSECMRSFLKDYDPYAAHPAKFPHFQILMNEYLYTVYYLSAIYGLVCPGQHWMADFAIFHAGAAAQGQFSYLASSVHHRVPKKFQAPRTGTAALVFWGINLSLLIFPQLFALWCKRDYEKFGRTYTVERVELIETEKSERRKRKDD